MVRATPESSIPATFRAGTFARQGRRDVCWCLLALIGGVNLNFDLSTCFAGFSLPVEVSGMSSTDEVSTRLRPASRMYWRGTLGQALGVRVELTGKTRLARGSRSREHSIEDELRSVGCDCRVGRTTLG